MDTCPACGSHRVFRSRTRTAFERYRRQLTSKRPYRCHACNWRGWGPDNLLVAAAGDVTDAPASPPDLHAIDSALGGSRAEGEKNLPAGDAAAAASGKPASGRRKRAPASRGRGKG